MFLMDLIILLSVRPEMQVEITKRIFEIINENPEDSIKELEDLCDVNNYNSPWKAGTIAHNAKVILDEVNKQLENA